MPIRALNLEVCRPDGRCVGVRVSVLPIVGMRREFESDLPAAVHAIDADQLEPPTAFRAYLGRLTAAQPDRTVLKAAIFEPDLGSLLEALGVDGPPPDPIRVELATT
jgi:hypothetical protein